MPQMMEQPSAISAAGVPPVDCSPLVSLIDIGVCCSDTLRRRARADVSRAQLQPNDLAAWAYVPETSGRCGYRALSSTAQ